MNNRKRRRANATCYVTRRHLPPVVMIDAPGINGSGRCSLAPMMPFTHATGNSPDRSPAPLPLPDAGLTSKGDAAPLRSRPGAGNRGV